MERGIEKHLAPLQEQRQRTANNVATASIATYLR